MAEEDERKPETVALEVPPRILADLRALVDAGLYLSLEEAVREALLNSWRFLDARCHRIRIEPDAAVDGDKDEKTPRDDA